MAGTPQRPAQATAGRVVVIGGSAGSIQVVQELLAALPASFAAPIFIVIHQSQAGPGLLPQVIGQRSRMPVTDPVDGATIEPGHVYVARPNLHLLVECGFIRCTRGPRENGFRPAIDAMFRTAAHAYGSRVISVVLSGWLDDGTLGSLLVKRAGGVTIAQDPEDSVAPDMPKNAIRFAGVDHVARSADIARLLEVLVSEPLAGVKKGAIAMHPEAHDLKDGARGNPVRTDPADYAGDGLVKGTMPGTPTGYTCPQCGGAIWETRDGKLLHYACHVGHAYSVDSFEAAQDTEVETALWVAYRMLQEKAALHKRLIDRAVEQGMPELADRYRDRERDALAQSETIRKVLLAPRDADATPAT